MQTRRQRLWTTDRATCEGISVSHLYIYISNLPYSLLAHFIYLFCRHNQEDLYYHNYNWFYHHCLLFWSGSTVQLKAQTIGAGHDLRSSFFSEGLFNTSWVSHLFWRRQCHGMTQGFFSLSGFDLTPLALGVERRKRGYIQTRRHSGYFVVYREHSKYRKISILLTLVSSTMHCDSCDSRAIYCIRRERIRRFTDCASNTTQNYVATYLPKQVFSSFIRGMRRHLVTVI